MTDRAGEARNLLDRFTNLRMADEASASADETLIDDLGDFGWLRGVRERCAMLELRQRSGNVQAVQYGWIERIEYDPSEGITLLAGSTTIRICGRDLNAEIRPAVRLFEGLTRHRVPWASESRVATPSRGLCQIDKVTW